MTSKSKAKTDYADKKTIVPLSSIKTKSPRPSIAQENRFSILGDLSKFPCLPSPSGSSLFLQTTGPPQTSVQAGNLLVDTDFTNLSLLTLIHGNLPHSRQDQPNQDSFCQNTRFSESFPFWIGTIHVCSRDFF